MIAVIGKIGVGKSTFLHNCGVDEHKIFFTDKFVEKEYRKNGVLYNAIKSKIGDFLIDDNGVSKSKIREWINQTYSNINILEKVVMPEIFRALKKGNYELVELPILVNENFDFLPLFNMVLCLSTSEQKRQKNLLKRNVDKSTLKALDKKNDTKKAIKALFSKIPVVDIYMDNFESIDQNKKILKLVLLML